MAYSDRDRSEQIGQEEPPSATSINPFRYCYIQCLTYHRKFSPRVRGNVRRPVPRLEAMNKFRLPEAFLVALKAVNVDPPFLFRKSGLPPTLCSSLLDYEDPNSFLRAFRVWEGVTPTEWRATQRAGLQEASEALRQPSY